MVVTLVVSLLFIADTCSGVIYHLNDSEYERMPPLYEMDPYRSCLIQPGGVYCVAKFELHGDQHNELIHTIREYSQHDIKHYNHSVIDRAICVTQTCKKFIHNEIINEVADLNVALEGCVNETVWTEYGLEAKLAFVMSCDRHGDDRVHLDLADWILVGILTSILAMNVIGSVYDIWYVKKHNEKKNTNGNPYLLSFSIFRSWAKLTNTDTDPKYERLNGVYGLKSIPSFFVASAHVMWLVGSGYTDNPMDFEMSPDSLHYQIIFSGMVIVQIFFLISGCLLAFHLQVISETKVFTWKDLPKNLFYRWARLTPAYAVVILFTGTWLPRLGSGPLWNVFVGGVATDCRHHGWKHLLYFNNYSPEGKYCAIQTWHMATEMQLFTLGLIVYLATASRGRYLALAFIALFGMIAPAMHVWLQHLDALMMFRPEAYRTFESDTFWRMHVLGHNNVSCHAIGMAVGLFAYYCIKNKIEYSNSKLLKYVTWCVPLGIIGLFLSGSLFYVDGERPPVALRMAYAAVHRPALGLMTAVLLLNLVLKFENGFRSVLEWRGWMVTSRLCYGVFLLHVNLVHIMLGFRTQLGHVSFFNLVTNHFAVTSLSFAAAVPFYLLLEAPMLALTKLLLGDSTEEKQKKIH